MNKRHYEHTLPNIRGSLSNTYAATRGQDTWPEIQTDLSSVATDRTGGFGKEKDGFPSEQVT